MAKVPIYILKVAADPNIRVGGHYKTKEHYIASMLMPHAIKGYGLTPDKAKEDLRKQMADLFEEQGIIEVQNDTLEL